MDDIKCLSALPQVVYNGVSNSAAAEKFIQSCLDDTAGIVQQYDGFDFPPASATSVTAVSRIVRSVFSDALAGNTKEDAFRAKLNKLGVAPAAIDLLSKGLFSRRNAVIATARERVSSALGAGSLVSFNWSVKHVVASDKLASVNEPLVALTLVVSRPGAGVEQLQLELSAAELDAVIAQLEAATAAAAAAAVHSSTA